MSKDYTLYEKMETPAQDLPVVFHRDCFNMKKGMYTFGKHWHEKIEFLYFIKGEACIICNNENIYAKAGDLVVVNSSELHEGYARSEVVEYYCLIVDTSLFQSRNIDICETKYIKPIYQNYIVFKNKIENDNAVRACIKNIVREFETKSMGFEIAVKAAIYQLLTILLRNHAKSVLTPREYDRRLYDLERFNRVIAFIDEHYHENITIDMLSDMVNLSRFRFCHLFKEITGKTLSEYVNGVRMDKAEKMLQSTGMNISEIALCCGYDDANYFSRVFKKYKHTAPSQVMKG